MDLDDTIRWAKSRIINARHLTSGEMDRLLLLIDVRHYATGRGGAPIRAEIHLLIQLGKLVKHGVISPEEHRERTGHDVAPINLPSGRTGTD